MHTYPDVSNKVRSVGVQTNQPGLSIGTIAGERRNPGPCKSRVNLHFAAVGAKTDKRIGKGIPQQSG